MVRSIPEKTFEHWSSMYVAHRFPRGGLWWPTQGEDIHVEDLGTLPGKSVLLEAKVPELTQAGTHVITVDLAQLRRYVSSIAPVYYIFPEPPWVGDLITSGWLGTERRADLAYRRAGARWFGEWTLVCRASDLLVHLAPSPGQKTATVTNPPVRHWRWFDFWTDLAHCGGPVMPSVFVVPTDDVATELEAGNGAINRSTLRTKLVGLRESLAEQGWSEERSRKKVERERYVERLRSTRKSVFVPLRQEDGSDLYREVSSDEFDASMREVLGVEDSGRVVDDSAGSHLSISAVPFDSLAL